MDPQQNKDSTLSEIHSVDAQSYSSYDDIPVDLQRDFVRFWNGFVTKEAFELYDSVQNSLGVLSLRELFSDRASVIIDHIRSSESYYITFWHLSDTKK